jgi:anti-sigma factor RsiW
MSPPRTNTRVCDATQAELQALLLDGEEPSLSVEELWSHVEACNGCARAIAHDQAMRRALSRVRRPARAPENLCRRLRDALAKRAVSGTKRPGGRSRSI